MSWRKFLGVTSQKDNEHEETPETDDEVTESDETISTDKRHYFLGIPFQKLSCYRLSQRCIQLTFLTLNTGIFFAGITGIVASIWMLSDKKIMNRLIGRRFFVTILLFMGPLVSFVAIIGIIGLTRRKRKFLNIYIACYSILLCIIFIAITLSFWLVEQIAKQIQDEMTSSIRNYQTWAREAWDNTHRYLKCCGIKSFTDWSKYQLSIPQSCCSRSIDQCLQMTGNVAYKSGCLKNAVLLLKSHIHTINVSANFVFLTLALCLFLAICIRRKVKLHRGNAN